MTKILGWTSGAALPAAFAAAVPAASERIAGDPLLALGAFALSALGLASTTVLEVRAQGKTSKAIDDQRAHAEQKDWRFKQAMEELLRAEGIDVGDTDPNDPRRPYRILFRCVRAYFEEVQSSIAAATTGQTSQIARCIDSARADAVKQVRQVFEQNVELGRRFEAFSLRWFERLEQLLDLARDDLIDLQQSVSQQASKLDELLQQTNPAPSLELTLFSATMAENDLVKRLTFRSQQMPLLSRETELGWLRAFLDDPKRMVSWWLWTGPAGLGKSRLALELCLEAVSRGWRAGFLKDSLDGHEWHDWKVERPTLMVVDDVAVRAKATARAINRMFERAADLRFPVRFLLLERSAEEHDLWWREFRGLDSHSEMLKTQGAQYEPPEEGHHEQPVESNRKPPVKLGPIGEDAAWEIIARVFRDRGKRPPQREEAIRTLQDIDKEMRPLLTAFYAEALVDGGDPTPAWDASRLTEAILNREVARWRESGADERHANLLALVTIIGEQPLEQLDRLTKKELNVPNLDELDTDLWKRMCGFATHGRDEKLTPLTPSLLGECFVLQRLRQDVPTELRLDAKNGLSISLHSHKLLEAALEDHPQRTVSFIVRAIDDFPTDPTVSKILEKPPSGKNGQKAWVTWAAIGLRAMVRADRPDKSEELWTRLSKGTWEFSDAPWFSNAKRFGLLRRAEEYALRRRYDLAISDFGEALELPGASVEERAWTYFNRGNALRRAEKPKEAAEDYTIVINTVGVPDDLQASALYNRGVVRDDHADYSAVLEIPDAPAEVRFKAASKLGRINVLVVNVPKRSPDPPA